MFLTYDLGKYVPTATYERSVSGAIRIVRENHGRFLGVAFGQPFLGRFFSNARRTAVSHSPSTTNESGGGPRFLPLGRFVRFAISVCYDPVAPCW